MANVIIEGEVVKVGDLPRAVRRLGFNSRMDIMSAANKFGTLAVPMKSSDIVEFFKEKEKETKK